MAGLLWQLFNILKEIFHRVLKFPELVLTLFGFRAPKKLKLRVVVLRDERGVPLARNEDVLPAFEEAQRILARRCGVIVEPAGWQVVTAPHAAPKAALDVRCTDGAWQDDLGRAGAFYRSLMATTTAGTLLGYGQPVTVFIVRSISTHNGCSLGAAAALLLLLGLSGLWHAWLFGPLTRVLGLVTFSLALGLGFRSLPALLGRMYPRLDEWRAVRDRLDPDGVLASDLSRRLGLT